MPQTEKMAHLFTVRFACVLNPTSIISVEKAASLLNTLSAQIATVQLPTERLRPVPRPRHITKPMREISVDGDLELMFIDDEAGMVAEAIDLLFYQDVSQIKVVVAKCKNAPAAFTDQNEILEAYVFGQMQPQALKHGKLDYVGAAEAPSARSTVTKTLTLKPTWAARGHANTTSAIGMDMLLAFY